MRAGGKQHRGNRARSGTGQPRTRDHFISYADPIRLDPGIPRMRYHEVGVAIYPLSQYPPYTLALAARMADVAEQYELDLLHVHYGAALHSSTRRDFAR